MVSADDNWVNCSFIHAQLTTVTIRKGEKIANSLVPLLKSGFAEPLFRSGTMSYYAIPRRNHHVRPVFVKKYQYFISYLKYLVAITKTQGERFYSCKQRNEETWLLAGLWKDCLVSVENQGYLGTLF